MGVIEQTARPRIKRLRIQDAIISVLYAGGALALLVAAPNAVRLLKHIDPDTAKRRHPSSRINQALHRLRNKGLVQKGANGAYTLTPRGELCAKLLDSRNSSQTDVSRRWDGRWRIVIFDIWESRREARDRLRNLLEHIGFIKLQNSVWAYPYDCEELLALIKVEIKVGSGMLYMIAEGIEGDYKLRRHFGLTNR